MSGRFLMDDSLYVERGWEVGCGELWKSYMPSLETLLGKGLGHTEIKTSISGRPLLPADMFQHSQPFPQSPTNSFLLK